VLLFPGERGHPSRAIAKAVRVAIARTPVRCSDSWNRTSPSRTLPIGSEAVLVAIVAASAPVLSASWSVIDTPVAAPCAAPAPRARPPKARRRRLSAAARYPERTASPKPATGLPPHQRLQAVSLARPPPYAASLTRRSPDRSAAAEPRCIVTTYGTRVATTVLFILLLSSFGSAAEVTGEVERVDDRLESPPLSAAGCKHR
jgi:hypothetical protein